MLKVWGRASSFNVQKAMWTIGELGPRGRADRCRRPVRSTRHAGIPGDEPERPNPCPEARWVVVWESHSIVRYLAATFGRGTLWPEDPAERSLTDRWMDWTAATLQPAFMDIFWGYYRTPEPERDWTVIQRGIDGCARLYGNPRSASGGAALRRRRALDPRRYPGRRDSIPLFRARSPAPVAPNVEAYYARLQDRLAYRLHVMVPFDELKGHTDY